MGKSLGALLAALRRLRSTVPCSGWRFCQDSSSALAMIILYSLPLFWQAVADFLRHFKALL